MKTIVATLVLLLMLGFLGAATIISANITASATWNLAGSPYIINGNYSIYNSTNPIVTIEAGVEVRFNANTSLTIGSNSSTIHGGMMVNGTAENPVLFTANSDTPEPGFWNFLRAGLHASIDNVVINHAIFEYGGSATGLFDVNGGNPQINNCTFRYSGGYGIYHSSNSISATVQNCSFVNNYGYPLHWNPNLVENIGSGNSFTGNNPNRILLKEIIINEGVSYADYGIPYEAMGHLYLRNASNPLVLNQNTQLLFRSGKYLYIGNTSSSSLSGSIQATGATFAEATSGAGWNGIDFQNFTQNSLLEGCTIKDIGSTMSGGVCIRSNNLTRILNCSFSNIDNYAITSNEGASFSISGSSFTTCRNTVSLYATDVHKLGAGNSYNGNTDNRIHCQGGWISTGASWTRQSVPIYVINNITIHGNDAPVVVIPYGSVLEFASGKSITIGSTSSISLTGTLLATGTTFRGAVFTPGYWTGLILQNHGGHSILSGCLIRDAGYNNAAAIQINVTYATVTGCTIYNNTALGINISAGKLAAISGNVIFLCGSYPLSIGANSLRVLGGDNYFTGNTIDRIEVRAENVSESGTWRNPGVPYYITASFTIYSGSPYPHINILPGTVIMLPNAASITIGTTSSSSLRGSLEASGVTFTRSSSDVIPLGIIFNSFIVDVRCMMTNCRFEYLQHNTQNSAVYVNGSAPAFSECTFINNPGGGIVGSTNARPSVLNCSFINNGGYPIKTNASAFDVVSGVGNYFSGNNPDRILISGSTLGQDYIWDNPSVPVEVSSDISVQGLNSPMLKINSGLALLFQSGAGIFIGSSSSPSLMGGVQADGATFSALNGEMGGWDGIQFDRYLLTNSYIRNCIIQYAGTNGNIRVNSSPLGTIESCIIRYGNFGIKLNGNNSNPMIIRNHILNNEVGIYCSTNANPLISGALADGNAIVGNTQYGVQNTSSLTLNAEYNWWGSVDGPTVRFGDAVTGNVDFTPWRTTNIGDSPARFHLLSPALGTLLLTATPVLDWEEAIDPTPGDVVTYTLQLCSTSAFLVDVISIPDLPSTVYHMPAGVLSDDTRYYWRVSATDTQGQTTWSFETYFWFDVAVPQAPNPFTVSSPGQDETVMVTSPLLSWTEAIDPDPGDAVSYTMYRDVSAGFENADSLLTDATSIYSEFCQPGTLYYWKVKATDQTERSTYTSLYRFFIHPDAVPRAPVEFLLQAVGNDITLQWDTVPGADDYHIYHSTTPDGSYTLLGVSPIPQYTHLGAALLPRGFYRVVSIDEFRRK